MRKGQRANPCLLREGPGRSTYSKPWIRDGLGQHPSCMRGWGKRLWKKGKWICVYTGGGGSKETSNFYNRSDVICFLFYLNFLI